VLEDEKAVIAVGFLRRAVAHSPPSASALRLMTDG
jgi:hypothetical protein